MSGWLSQLRHWSLHTAPMSQTTRSVSLRKQILIMKEGDVILAPLPQADGQIKNRPALFLRELPPFQDALVCGISTQLHQWVIGFDELITSQDDDFASSG